ncbi:carbonic anhydrase-related protein 10-like isoform X2 [Varroa jacobsoni]|uniref:Alpha-carbonic anhydrase domain-containing protein n=1 Tax=Varroa destructor TaxID=109461 RepID=A0A7M7MK12_VARDE|nr:carbonic anhydrase-related protein 10-like isoform X2 [Varroa destructor]XP_022687518.1 carbonic anhydrase-related protein 10-like isoform X2 [Varroa jacobsoni]
MLFSASNIQMALKYCFLILLTTGPDFWGLLNPDWHLCTKGRRQSPINIDPQHLLFDHQLQPLQVDKTRVSGNLVNTGHGIVFRVSDSESEPAVFIRGGPLSYGYRFYELHLHYGKSDDQGSEHTIASKQFPAELQLFGFNSDLYANVSEALELRESSALVAISILVQLAETPSPELRVLTSPLRKIVYRGQEAIIQHLSVKELLPDTTEYMTYDGSLTMPGCYETVRWIVMNKPVYVTKQQLYLLRKLMQGDDANPKAPMWDNFRPPLPLNRRVTWTNIDFHNNNKVRIGQKGNNCPQMKRETGYRVNPKYIEPVTLEDLDKELL